ncbi:hypothetical protein HLB35_06025 [Halomonas sp. TBZ9]|uniref:Uncharacterized protein n=1 Tax=Vreelandella azerica TaxID=2732867 RepID=A0A7Y3TX86_9GAMM|nr:hypothetical protein [Halomonas azerica]NOG31435.1 hypothetical protein [Halomonas azerica]
MYILIKKLSSVAVVLTIIGFSGVGSFWDISAEIKSLPLVSTILNNDGWVNGLMFSSAVYMVNYQMSELNKGLIVRKIRHKEFSLHHQENVNFIIREIKKVDGELFFISILFYFFLVYFLFFLYITQR